MKVFCYTRTENVGLAQELRDDMARACGLRRDDFCGFQFDGLAGQRWLTATLRKAEHETGDRMIMVDSLSDLAKDLPGVVKQIETLLEKGIAVEARKTRLLFDPHDAGNRESKVILALAQAHHRYVSENRKRGVATAKAAGASPGRPVTLTLDDVRKTIKRLTDSNAGELPSARDLAKEAECGKTKAAQLLNEYKAERDTKPNGEAQTTET